MIPKANKTHHLALERKRVVIPGLANGTVLFTREAVGSPCGRQMPGYAWVPRVLIFDVCLSIQEDGHGVMAYLAVRIVELTDQ